MKEIEKWILSWILVAIVIFIAEAMAMGAIAEIGTVTIVVYEDDTYIVDFESHNDLYENRGDLLPGDVVSVSGNEIVLVSQGDGNYVEVWMEGEPIAAVLYPEDVEWAKEAAAR